MKKITAKYINDNLKNMFLGERVNHRGATYRVAPTIDDAGTWSTENGTIYYISEDRNILGAINGYEYGKVVNGVAYKH